MDVSAKLVQKHREDTDREEWALVSRKDESKVLEWFGPEKPSDEKVQKAEARVQFFKHHASVTERVAYRARDLRAALGVKPLLQETKRRRALIDQALQTGDVGTAKKLFMSLGEKLKPLASVLDGVTITRGDEARKLKNIKLWLRQISYPFDPKDLNGPHADVYISQGIGTVEDALKSLSRVESRLESYLNVEAEFKHGPFTVINRHGFRSDEYGDALAVLDEAAQKIQAKGFGSVVYGKVYLVSAGQGKMRKGWAGMYREGTDEFLLNVEARHRHDSIFTIVHELGHRHWHKALSGAQRVLYEALYSQGALTLEARQDMWQALVKGQFSPRKSLPFLQDKSRADDLIAYFKDQYSATGLSQRDLGKAYERGEAWVEQNFVRPRSPYVFIGDPSSKKTVTVSDYAKTNVKEDYAETFAFYVLGMPIPPEVMERFRPAIGKTARELTYVTGKHMDNEQKATFKSVLKKLASAESVVRCVQADLAPQLGKPGGPCHVVRRLLK